MALPRPAARTGVYGGAESAVALADFLHAVEAKRRTITVYSPASPDWIADQFATRNVDVEYEPLPPDSPTGFAVIYEGDEFVASIGLEELQEIVEPPIRRPWEPPPESSGYRALFDLLENTVFTAFDRRQLLGAAREIEDRAWRVGSGTLRVGFQRLSAMRSQVPVYERLAAETDLAIHLYGDADWEPPSIGGATVHRTDAGEIGDFWFLAFDGGDERSNACALLAEERRPDAFYGFWTYDVDSVDDLLSYLATTYG